MGAVSIRNVRKSYGAVDVLHDISVDIAEGEFAVLVGPSGCGKSTLLRMIAGLEEITEGEIAIAGKVVNGLEPKDRDIAMVFQTYALYPHMTVAENMGFSLKLARVPREEIRARVATAAAMLGLEPYLDRLPKALSGGQRQRVAMGRAMVRNPTVFLFDEPLSNLDAKLRVQMRSEIRQTQQRLKTTTVYVTHDQIEAMTMADRIIVMNAGHIEQVGTPLELYDRPANRFVAQFIGSPAMNLIPGRIEGTELVAVDGTRIPIGSHFASGEVLLGLRSEYLRLDPAGLPARIVSIEPTGAETLVVLHLAGQDITAAFRDRISAPAGAELRIGFDPAQAHLFDAKTGLRR